MEQQEPRIDDYKTWVEGRDKWYVDTLVQAAVPPEDILSMNWQPHYISIKIDTVKKQEVLCIKGKPIGEPYPMHGDHLAKILIQQSQITNNANYGG